MRDQKREKKETMIEFVHELDFIASQENLTPDVVREYTATGFTDAVYTWQLQAHEISLWVFWSFTTNLDLFFSHGKGSCNLDGKFGP